MDAVQPRAAQLKLAQVAIGDSITFREEGHAYRVRARSSRYLVCTKPFNLRRTVLYTVVDTQKQVRGTENLVFGMGAETDEECQEMVSRLEGKIDSEPTEVSYRNRVPLDIVAIRRRGVFINP